MQRRCLDALDSVRREIEYTLELLDRKQRYAHQMRTEAMERRAEVGDISECGTFLSSYCR